MAEIRDQYLLDIDQALRSVDRVQAELDTLESSIRQSGGAAEGIEADFRGVAAALDVSEGEARRLTSEILDAQTATRRTEAEARDLASALGLSERDARDLATQMDRVRRETQQADDAASGFAGRLGNVRGLLATGIAAVGFSQVVRQFDELVQAASDVEQSIGGVQAIFQEAADPLLEFGQTAAQSVGLAESAANALAAQLGGQLQTFGFNASEAARETQNLIGLGADLAATFGGPVSQAVEAIGSLLRGEVNPIERYGVSLNQTVIANEALRQGLISTRSELGIQERAVAALSLLYEQTANAQGQFAREVDTTAGQLERFRAEAENVRAEIGEALVPAFNEAVAQARELLPEIAELAPAFGALAENVLGTVGGLVEVALLFESLVDPITDTLSALQSTEDVEPSGVEAFRESVLNTINPFRQLGNAVDELRLGLSAGFGSDTLNRTLDQLRNSLELGTDPVQALQFAFEDLSGQGRVTEDVLNRLIETADAAPADLFRFLREATATEGLTPGELEVLRDAIEAVVTSLGNATEARSDFESATGQGVEELAAGLDDVSAAAQRVQFERIIEGFTDTDEAAAGAADAIRGFIDAQLAAVDPTFAALDAEDQLVEAKRRLEELRGNEEATQREILAATREVAQAEARRLAALEAVDAAGLQDVADVVESLLRQADVGEDAIADLVEDLLDLDQVSATAEILTVFSVTETRLGAREAFEAASAAPTTAQARLIVESIFESQDAVDEAETQAGSVADAYAAEFSAAVRDEREFTRALSDSIVEAAAQAETDPRIAAAFRDLAASLRIEVPVGINPENVPVSALTGLQGSIPGATGNVTVNVEQTFVTQGDVPTDAARAGQSLSRIINQGAGIS